MLWFAVSAAIFPQDFGSDERDVLIKRVEQVRFFSKIDADSVRRLADILEQGDIVNVNGPGGEVSAMFDMAELLRERGARVKVAGECFSACSFVWTVAPERLTDGFSAVTFHGTPVTALALIRRFPNIATPQLLTDAENNAAAMERVLADAGVETWLFHCAYRLMQHEWTPVSTGSSVPPFAKLEGGSQYSRVWFPREILQQAGIDHLEKFDDPTPEQRGRLDALNGPDARSSRIYWAEPGDCDPERTASGNA